MRMTNKIMQNNSLYNINNNKLLQDKLATQMSTQKKLTRPSDDPIVAIRALRLRTSVSELTQFKDKNAKDAEAWLTVTEDALSSVSSIIGAEKGLISEMQRAANKDLTPTDISNIMEQIRSLRDAIYDTANADYAGRYIFTGYRTDTPLSFTKDVLKQKLSYNITEQLNLSAFDMVNYTDIGALAGLSKSNYTETAFANVAEQNVENVEIRRLRLAYDQVNADPGKTPVISYLDPGTGLPVDVVGGSSGIVINTISASTVYDGQATPPVLDAYQTIRAMNEAGTAGAVFIPETGEILFSDAAYSALTAPPLTATTEIRVTYDKDSWKEGDLRPEHYFHCVSEETMVDGSTKTINYNADYLSGASNRQIIEYDVGYNQRIQVNTLAEDVFKHTMDRNVDDLDKAVRELLVLEMMVKDLEAVMEELGTGHANYPMLRNQYDAAKKAYDHLRDNVHRMFENSITVMQKALDGINLAVTDSGTRSARLDLISNRLLSQKTTFEVLRSENEDINIAEVAVKLTSAELSYNAALMATGRIMQTSLMNYI